MLLVVLGHVIQSVLTTSFDSNHLWNMIYSFHMPAFMAISGWLFYRGTAWGGNFRIVVRRFQQLMIPYFMWSLISFWKTGTYTFGQLSKMILYPDTFFWFLWVLFYIQVLFTTAQYISNKIKVDEIYPLLFTCILLFMIMVLFEFRMFGFQFIAYYILFYFFGYCLHKYKIRIGTKTITILFVLWAIMAWSWNMHNLPSWFPSTPFVSRSLIQYVYRGLTAGIAILILLCYSPKVLAGEDWLNMQMQKFGQDSLGIYVVHLIWGSFVIDIVGNCIANETFIVIIASTITLGLSIGTVYILKKNSITARFFLGKI